MEYSEKVQAELASAQETSIANKIIDMLQKLKLNNDETTSCRWIWELIQNAKDVTNDTGTVDIKINFDKQEKCLVFQHNGKCFTTKNIVYLISQVSSKERDDSEEKKTTGKFGTGFLTTHLLSEKVTIEGLLQDSGDRTKKISIFLDRSGQTKAEIIKSVNSSFTQLESSKEIEDYIEVEQFGYNTKFIYQLDDEGVKTAERGIESLCISAPYIYTFLNEINSIIINDIIKFKRGQVRENNDIALHSIQCDKQDGTSEILILSLHKGDVKVAVPVTYENESVFFKAYAKGTPKLFCDFPLIGTEDFSFPVVVNSSCFNPTEPRNGIFLTDKENPVIEENKKLMLQALEAYKALLDYAEKYKWKQTYNVVSICNQSPQNWLSSGWLKENIIETCKTYIKEAVIIDTEKDERKSLYDWLDDPEVLIVGDSDKQLREHVWNLAQYIYLDKLPLFGELHKWYDSLWSECRNFNISELIKCVEFFGNIESLDEKLIGDMDSTVWLNMLYGIIVDSLDQEEYEKFKIFPNQLGGFCTLEELYYDNGIEEEYKDVLELLGKECRNYIMDNRINIQDKIQRPVYDYDFLFKEIEFRLDNTCEEYRQAIGKLMVLYDNATQDDQEQIALINMIDAMFVGELSEECKVKYISNSIMKKVKNYWCTVLADAVSECKCICELENILNLPEKCTINQWIAKFIDYLVRYKHINLLDKKTKPILPNQNGVFKTEESLFLDSGEIGELFKDILVDSGEDIRESLLLADIYLDLPENRTKFLKDISQNIVNYVKDNQGKIKNQDLKIIENFKKLYLWIIDHEDKAKRYFGELIENKHWLYNDHEIADNMRKAEVYDDILKKYNIHDSRGLETILKQHAKEKESYIIEEEITEEILVQCGISSEEDFSKAIGKNVFGNNFVHISESDPDKFSFVEKILERSKNNIFQYLKGLEEYDLSDPIPANNTVFIIKKHGKETFLITRPSDYGQVVLYYDLEKDVLDYEKEWELWVEDGKSKPERITFGKMMKLTGINKIPLRKVT